MRRPQVCFGMLFIIQVRKLNGINLIKDGVTDPVLAALQVDVAQKMSAAGDAAFVTLNVHNRGLWKHNHY